MAKEPWRAYLELALGVTEASRKRAKKTVKRLIGTSGATAEQLQSLAEDLLRVGLENRESVIRMIRTELDKAMIRLGVVGEDEVTELKARIKDLEDQLRAYQAQQAGTAKPEPPAEPTAQPESSKPAPGQPASSDPASSDPVTVAKKVVAKKRVAKKATASKVFAPVPEVPEPVVPEPVVPEVPLVPEAAGPVEQATPDEAAAVTVPRKAATRRSPTRKVPAKRPSARKAAADTAPVAAFVDPAFADPGAVENERDQSGESE